ncbi:BadF/BadG/BcrA/BcrD ATPase family protein [Lentisphaerota bacterium ZTH]|nr:hypothetical protein JYG24_01250 [Lentisphaerota bacterium]WET05241.1 BadF/BadG/BcrA/BcrD ATPase family protein [Lentisphaerota bacterium ZTH]
MDYYLGIDAGGTRTRCVMADCHGHILSFGTSSTASLGSAEKEKVIESLTNAITDCTESIQGFDGRIKAAFAGAASVVLEEERQYFCKLINDVDGISIEKTGAHHDIHTALKGGLCESPGVALISGTGSSCYGINKDEKSWQAGGWEYIVDDLGSAYYLATRALSAAAKDVDGRGEKTALTPLVFDYFKLKSWPEVIMRLHTEGFRGRPLGKKDIAGFAPSVSHCAEQGDEIALDIIKTGMNELAMMVEAVCCNLGLAGNEQKLILTGSVINNPFIRKIFQQKLRKLLPDMQICDSIFPPVVGALLEAMRISGIKADDEIKKNLKNSVVDICHFF